MTLEELQLAVTEAFEQSRVEVTRHFWDEMRADAFVLADIRCALDAILSFRLVGKDYAGNTKIEMTGLTIDGRELSVVSLFKETGALLLITVYEGHQS